MRENLTIGERLHELRLSRSGPEKTQSGFAKATGITRQALSGYERGEIIPNGEVLRTISRRFEVSVDWLVGLSHVMSPDETIRGVCKYTGLSEKAIERVSRELHNETITLRNAWGYPTDEALPNDNKPLIGYLDRLICDDAFILWLQAVQYAVEQREMLAETDSKAKDGFAAGFDDLPQADRAEAAEHRAEKYMCRLIESMAGEDKKDGKHARKIYL